MISKNSVLFSQGTKYVYSFHRFPFVIPILVICDTEMNMQCVSGAPKYIKCATSTKVLETTRVSVCHAILNVLMSHPSQPKLNKPELFGGDSK